jgi:hypothetical protein
VVRVCRELIAELFPDVAMNWNVVLQVIVCCGQCLRLCRCARACASPGDSLLLLWLLSKQLLKGVRRTLPARVDPRCTRT